MPNDSKVSIKLLMVRLWCLVVCDVSVDVGLWMCMFVKGGVGGHCSIHQPIYVM